MREIQTLIFSKNSFTRTSALRWAKKHGFKYYTSRLTKDDIRIRQFPLNQIKKVLGQFQISKDVKALYTIKK